jgi:hypothetical protein
MVGKQLGFGDYEQTTAKKRTKREKFLAEMVVFVPWKPLIDLIEPQGRLKVRHGLAGAAMLVPVLSGLLPSVGRPRCPC